MNRQFNFKLSLLTLLSLVLFSCNITLLEPEYTVTLNANGGVFSEDAQSSPIFSATSSNIIQQGVAVATNAKINLPQTNHLFKKGYTLIGWTESTNADAKIFQEDTIIASDIILYAKWCVSSLTVTFVNVTDSGTNAVKQVTCNEKVSQPIANLANFVGWYTDGDFTTEFNFDSPITQDTSVYARWKKQVTFVLPKGLTFYGQSGLAPIWVPEKNKITNPNLARLKLQAKVDKNRAIMGWYTDATLTSPFTTDMVVTNNIILYPKLGFKVTFKYNDMTTEDKLQIIASSANAQRPSDPTKNGYSFLGWDTDQANEALTSEFDFDNTPITASITLYAKWKDTSTKGPTSPN